MSLSQANGGVRVSLDSKLEEVPRFQDAIAAELKKRRFAQREIFSIRLALEEALVNAIKHGNRLDPLKTVEIQYTVEKNRFKENVADSCQ